MKSKKFDASRIRDETFKRLKGIVIREYNKLDDIYNFYQEDEELYNIKRHMQILAEIIEELEQFIGDEKL